MAIPADEVSDGGSRLMMPPVIVTTAPHLLGSLHGCPVPMAAYCPPFDFRQLSRHLRAGAFHAPEFNERRVVAPVAFLALAGARGLLPTDIPPETRQKKFASTMFARAWELQFWREECLLLRSAIENDTPLPLPFFGAYAARTKFFSYFQNGLPKWRHGRYAAVLPSQFTNFVRQETGL